MQQDAQSIQIYLVAELSNQWGPWFRNPANGQVGRGDRVLSSPFDALFVRLHELRGALNSGGDAPVCEQVFGSQSSAAMVGYGRPIAFSSMCFRLRPIDV